MILLIIYKYRLFQKLYDKKFMSIKIGSNLEKNNAKVQPKSKNL